MNTTTKFYLATAAAVVLILAAADISSRYKVGKLQREIDAAKRDEQMRHSASDRQEREAAVYMQKIEYLEKSLVEIQAIARKQDEEMERLNSNSAAARTAMERAKSVRSIAATTGELCKKLGELGHPCE